MFRLGSHLSFRMLLRMSQRISIKLLLSALLGGLLFSNWGFAQQDKSVEEYQAAAAAYQSGDFAAAEKLWKTLADQGDANAQYAMGIMHLKKEAQGARDQIAFAYLAKAAKNRHVAAMFNLGVAYWEGRGTQRQPAKAANWWELAAQQQDAGAQYNLGLAYYLGVGRKQDASKAKYWLEQAMQNGHPQAKPLLDQIASNAKLPEAVPAKKITKASRPASAKPLAQQKKVKPAVPKMTKSERVKATNQAAQKAITAGSSVAKQSVLKAAPNEASATILSLQPGTKFRLIKRGTHWSKIRLSEPFPVWVHESLLKDLGNGKGEIKGNNVNIRPSPSTDKVRSPALGQLSKGDIVMIRSRRAPWVEILSAAPFPGWVQNDAL